MTLRELFVSLRGLALKAMPSFKQRTHQAEWMDDFDITDQRLLTTLDQLRAVNRFLGGYAVTMRVLRPFLEQHARQRTVSILDLGTGVADFPEVIVRWASRRGLRVQVTAIDANPVTIAYARQRLQARLLQTSTQTGLKSGFDRRTQPSLSLSKATIRLDVADVLHLPYAPNSFDVVLATSILHHFDDATIIEILRAMQRLARHGFIVNDLHRHPLAFYSVRLLFKLLGASPMMQHDGPLSVRRSFRRDELLQLAHAAKLGEVTVRWQWAFRWLLTTL